MAWIEFSAHVDRNAFIKIPFNLWTLDPKEFPQIISKWHFGHGPPAPPGHNERGDGLLLLLIHSLLGPYSVCPVSYPVCLSIIRALFFAQSSLACSVHSQRIVRKCRPTPPTTVSVSKKGKHGKGEEVAIKKYCTDCALTRQRIIYCSCLSSTPSSSPVTRYDRWWCWPNQRQLNLQKLAQGRRKGVILWQTTSSASSGGPSSFVGFLLVVVDPFEINKHFIGP